MDQINTSVFYKLGADLRGVFLMLRGPIVQWVITARTAKSTLDALLSEGGSFKLDESSVAAQKLGDKLQNFITTYDNQNDASLSDNLVAEFNALIWTFDQAIALELGRAPIFYVTSKGVYDTRRLISEAQKVYEGYADRLSIETISDTNEAGRCLAFSLPTAAGFHIARATESTIKQYMAAYGCEPVKDGQRNWGNYIKVLESKGANSKITHHLKQLKDLHRNPVTHPEVRLSMPEAVALWAISTSLIQSMVGDMETKRSNPSAEIVALSPPSDQPE